MNLPPPRVCEVLALLKDLRPEEARVLLAQVVATLDAVEVLALRAWLPPQAVRCLPSCVGAVTVMNEAPMPWEVAEPPPAPAGIGVETGKIIESTLPSHKRLRVSVAAAACVLVVGGLSAWMLSGGDDAPLEREEVAHLVPLPPAKQYAPMKAQKVAKVKKVITRSARKTAPTASRSEPADWASPFERRQ